MHKHDWFEDQCKETLLATKKLRLAQVPSFLKWSLGFSVITVIRKHSDVQQQRKGYVNKAPE